MCSRNADANVRIRAMGLTRTKINEIRVTILAENFNNKLHRPSFNRVVGERDGWIDRQNISIIRPFSEFYAKNAYPNAGFGTKKNVNPFL
jgi:hypothetical protein